jgi:hypothetical protein
MKNIFLIKTSDFSHLSMAYLANPSYLRFSKKGFKYDAFSSNDNRHLYITSEEEIKVGDWMIRDNEQPTLVTPNFFWDFGVKYHKIILTTDPTLIEDGVQAIDDEFLEWFVKNPTCEFVEVRYGVLKPFQSVDKGYTIHLPGGGDLEEPKQETVKDLTYWKNNCEEDYLHTPISVLKYISKLEEAAGEYANKELKAEFSKVGNFHSFSSSFIAGAEWQSERMFGLVDEYNQMLVDPNVHEDHKEISFKEWFEQFKKK